MDVRKRADSATNQLFNFHSRLCMSTSSQKINIIQSLPSETKSKWKRFQRISHFQHPSLNGQNLRFSYNLWFSFRTFFETSYGMFRNVEQLVVEYIMMWF